MGAVALRPEVSASAMWFDEELATVLVDIPGGEACLAPVYRCGDETAGDADKGLRAAAGVECQDSVGPVHLGGLNNQIEAPCSPSDGEFERCFASDGCTLCRNSTPFATTSTWSEAFPHLHLQGEQCCRSGRAARPSCCLTDCPGRKTKAGSRLSDSTRFPVSLAPWPTKEASFTVRRRPSVAPAPKHRPDRRPNLRARRQNGFGRSRHPDRPTSGPDRRKSQYQAPARPADRG